MLCCVVLYSITSHRTAPHRTASHPHSPPHNLPSPAPRAVAVETRRPCVEPHVVTVMSLPSCRRRRLLRWQAAAVALSSRPDLQSPWPPDGQAAWSACLSVCLSVCLSLPLAPIVMAVASVCVRVCVCVYRVAVVSRWRGLCRHHTTHCPSASQPATRLTWRQEGCVTREALACSTALVCCEARRLVVNSCCPTPCLTSPPPRLASPRVSPGAVCLLSQSPRLPRYLLPAPCSLAPCPPPTARAVRCPLALTSLARPREPLPKGGPRRAYAAKSTATPES